jgi:hypothetical protein
MNVSIIEQSSVLFNLITSHKKSIGNAIGDGNLTILDYTDIIEVEALAQTD